MSSATALIVYLFATFCTSFNGAALRCEKVAVMNSLDQAELTAGVCKQVALPILISYQNQSPLYADAQLVAWKCVITTDPYLVARVRL